MLYVPLVTARRTFLVLAFCMAVAGCASVPATREDAGAVDPLEPLNRVVFDFNMALDHDVIEPIARAYRDAVPQFVRDRIRSAIDNLAEPRIFVNDILQWRGDAAGITFARFFVNTTVGFAGFFDQATESGLPRQTGDFGQTLYSWGIADGPYLVLLFFGPSNVRDAVGLGVDLYTTPPAHLIGPTHLIGGHDPGPLELAIGVTDGIDLRSRNIDTIAEMKKGALDVYVHFRSIFRQYRRAQLRAARGETEEPEELVDPGATSH